MCLGGIGWIFFLVVEFNACSFIYVQSSESHCQYTSRYFLLYENWSRITAISYRTASTNDKYNVQGPLDYTENMDVSGFLSFL